MIRTRLPDGSFVEKTQTRTFSQIQAENAVIKETFPEINQMLSPCGIPLGAVILTKEVSEEDTEL